ncbi:MAG: MFS transporter, partial [Acutalibacter sp.]|nr:MFS transporter [Acutalibacter sp.]
NTRAIAGMSVFFTVNNIAIVLTRMFAGRLTRWLSSGKLVTLGMIVLGAGNLIIVFALNLPVMLAASVLIGVGTTLYAQLLQADILRQVDESRRGVANSTFMLAQDLGTGAGASAFGVTSEYLGYPVTFAVSAIVTWLGLPICLKTYRKKK